MKFQLVLLVNVLFVSFCFGQNHFRNGKFDGTPSITKWKGEVGEVISQTKGGNPGGYAWLNHSGGKSDPSISQEVTGLTPGLTYMIRGDYKGGTNVHLHLKDKSAKCFSIDVDGKSIKKLALPSDMYEWSKFTAIFTATKTTHTIRFRGEIDGTDGDVAIDNVFVRPDLRKGYYRLTTKFQGEQKSLDIINDDKDNKLELRPTGNKTGQMWKLTYLKNGYYRLTTKFTGEDKSLDIINDDKDNKLEMRTTGNKTGQLWKLHNINNSGYYRLTTKFTGTNKALDIINDDKDNQLEMRPVGKYTGQMWKITKIK